MKRFIVVLEVKDRNLSRARSHIEFMLEAGYPYAKGDKYRVKLVGILEAEDQDVNLDLGAWEELVNMEAED